MEYIRNTKCGSRGVKRTIWISLLSMLLSVCVSSANAQHQGELIVDGLTETWLGGYAISPSDETIELGEDIIAVHELAYDNSKRTILIGVVPRKNGVDYLVCCKKMRIQYTIRRERFGVKTLRAEWRSRGYELFERMIDRKHWDAQKLITSGIKDEKEYLGLIACYLPHLIANEYREACFGRHIDSIRKN
ncbi:hypothetical protein EYV94_12800 [Puteibacter caeruleilacunae]|nr:hypothetical protein EYV94_12800 [Puteibacter caeruleilacunae]